MPLVPGKEAVKNLSCFWQFTEYINCTWELRADAPRNVQYRLLYWNEGTNSLPESTQFEDLLRTGNECQEYYTSGGMRLGCKFTYEYSIKDHKKLMFVVTDTLYSVRPYFYYTAVRHIAKLKSPNITNVSEPINKVIHVTWTALSGLDLLFEVLVSSDTWSFPHMVNRDTHVTITIPHADDTFRVKVRAKLSRNIATSVFWSEWSQEWIVPGKNKTTTSILLFLLIPAAVLVAAVVLLVFLKRLKILIFPPIPHPGKMFQNDVQHWLRGDRPATVYDQPLTEEITAVTALEA
ncbi:interleukin-13 receptor subunit alpha-1-like isoform X2 [Bufo bufo]|nr:interleukin-13 receptor subunit alpha-1-like isoform X2 [Bufo bufo]